MQFNWRWRIAAGMALLLYVLTVLAVVRLALNNFLFVSLLGLTLAVLAFAAWTVFTGQGRRFWFGVILGVISGVALLINVFFFAKKAGNIRSVLIIGLLGLAYSGLFAILRNEYWQAKRRQGATQATSFKKPFLLINPKSGNGRAIKAHIPEAAEAMGIKIHILEKGQDIEKLAEAAIKDGADVLGISGGDGTIGAVAKVAIKHDLPVVVLPGGTRCHFARDLGLDPKKINDAMAGFNGVERRIDVGTINGRIFLNNASFGLYADIVDNPDYRDNKVAVSRNVMQEHIAGKKKPYSLRIKQNGKDFSSAVIVQVCVGRYNSVKLMDLGQREELDTGILQVSLISKLDDAMLRNIIKTVGLVQLKNHKIKNFYQWDTKTLKVGSKNSSVVVGVDGEREKYKTPVTIKNLPKSLRLYVPAEGVRNRAKKSFSTDMPKTFLQTIKGQD